MEYGRAFVWTYAGLVAMSFILAIVVPLPLAALLGAIGAIVAGIALHPRQRWWREQSEIAGSATSHLPNDRPISRSRNIVVYVLAWVIMGIAVAAGLFVAELRHL